MSEPNIEVQSVFLTYKEREYLNLKKINENFLGGVPISKGLVEWAKLSNKKGEYATVHQNVVDNSIHVKPDD